MQNPFRRMLDSFVAEPIKKDYREFISPLISTCPKKQYSHDSSFSFRSTKEKLPDLIVDRMFLSLCSLCEEDLSIKKPNQQCRKSLIQPKMKLTPSDYESSNFSFKNDSLKSSQGDLQKKMPTLGQIQKTGKTKFQCFIGLKRKIQLVQEVKKEYQKNEKVIELIQEFQHQNASERQPKKDTKMDKTSLEKLLEVQSVEEEEHHPKQIRYRNRNYHMVDLEQIQDS